ncbi:hypothetical protein PIROE2DRAFT_16919 [Piromyces sp. E2]|nr:hypothetical protein PIROE2DRAFT_16919 [Piromyces sp. E2]|eukprot:OUM57947.1 hypothetical protein PIROE2DRAFT_16919 [Piromyces sp. E2]
MISCGTNENLLIIPGADHGDSEVITLPYYNFLSIVFGHKKKFGNCITTGFFVDCYRKNGSSMDTFVAQDHSYLNPFSSNCGKIVKYTVNVNDKNCYYAEDVGYRYNNRCLVGNGWCPC